MKLVLYDDYRLGLLRDDGVVDCADLVAGLGASVRDRVEALIGGFDLLRPGLQERLASGRAIPLAAVRLRAPDPEPRKILCAFASYREEGRVKQIPPNPDYFLKSPQAVIGPEETVVLPDRNDVIVFQPEAELGVVMARRAQGVSPHEALDYVFGYVPFIDVSARGNLPATQFERKSWDTFAPLGPCIVTADEIADPNKLQVRLWVSGVLRQDYNTDDAQFPVARMVSFASSVTTLMPGDVLAMGTNHKGLGPMNDGDQIELEIERIGRLRVGVRNLGTPKNAYWRPPVYGDEPGFGVRP